MRPVDERLDARADRLDAFVERVDALVARVEALLPPAPSEPDWGSSTAFRWRRRGGRGGIEAVRHVATIGFDRLRNIDRQRAIVERNTRRFVDGLPANHVLLTGARGTGKSSLVRACLDAYAARGLRLVEVDRGELVDLPDLVGLVAARPERFVVFCDDLSFEEGESGYKALKVALDGSVAAASDNVLIYATSNRRHLMPERMRDNVAARRVARSGASTGGTPGGMTGRGDDDADDEIHPGDGIEEKISLAERFGIHVTFSPFRQTDYLAAVETWMRHYGADDAAIADASADALRWALERGSRSGRVAHQFARDRAGSTRA